MFISEFLALVEKAKVVEGPQVEGPSRSKPKYGDKMERYYRPQSYRSGGPSSHLQSGAKCYKCGGSYVVKFCPLPIPNVTCDKCH